MQEMLLNGRMRTSSITLTLACVICELVVGVCPCHIYSSTAVVSLSPNIRQPCVIIPSEMEVAPHYKLLVHCLYCYHCYIASIVHTAYTV